MSSGRASQVLVILFAAVPQQRWAWTRVLRVHSLSSRKPFSQEFGPIDVRPKQAPAGAPKMAARHPLCHRRQKRVFVESGLQTRTARSAATQHQLRSRECEGCQLYAPSFFAAPRPLPCAPVVEQRRTVCRAVASVPACVQGQRSVELPAGCDRPRPSPLQQTPPPAHSFAAAAAAAAAVPAPRTDHCGSLVGYDYATRRRADAVVRGTAPRRTKRCRCSSPRPCSSTASVSSYSPSCTSLSPLISHHIDLLWPNHDTYLS